MLSTTEKIFYDGFLYNEFKETNSLSKVISISKDAVNKKVKEDFFLIEKYNLALDLKPSVVDYDECFLQLLKDNDIPSLLNKTGFDLRLSNIQLRIAYPGSSNKDNSYMPWHRDSYHYHENEKPSGKTPPGFKILFYPDINESQEEVVSLVPRSQLQQKFREQEDYVQQFSFNMIKLKADSKKYLFFNTSIMHGTLPTEFTQGQPRIIYNFCNKFQLDNEEAKDISNKYMEFISD